MDLYKSHNFRELTIWKDSMSLVKEIYNLTKDLPNDEKFGLTSQINRCSISIPSNIAEGSGRNSEKDFIRFLRIAVASSFELETQLILVKELFSIETSEIISKLTRLQMMIGAFIRKLNNN